MLLPNLSTPKSKHSDPNYEELQTSRSSSSDYPNYSLDKSLAPPTFYIDPAQATLPLSIDYFENTFVALSLPSKSSSRTRRQYIRYHIPIQHISDKEVCRTYFDKKQSKTTSALPATARKCDQVCDIKFYYLATILL
jgi:hypothetical protein